MRPLGVCLCRAGHRRADEDRHRGHAPDRAGGRCPTGVPPGSDVVYRRRHACVGDDVLQVQQAWYPRPVALQAGLTTTRKIEGGVYGALTASGMAPSELDETIRGRMPTADEAELLHTGTGVPLLTVERVTRGSDGQPLELLRVTAPADRIEFVYNNLPLPSGGTA
ncbi:GntR family transcriptional regulator [Streptomyces sp. SHP22-7]|nr:GntR family transcriptional regulator [Streptomyces sp. SHP22-7]